MHYEIYRQPFIAGKWYFITACIFYLIMVTMFKNGRKTYILNLKKPLFWWNVFMSVFSLFGFVIGFADFLNKYSIQRYSNDMICDYYWFSEWTIIALTVFNLSKIIEFVDTIFMVLRGRRIILLHYYHHVITFLFCWYSQLHVVNAIGFYFAMMNYFVHFIMYAYYAYTTIGYRTMFDKYLSMLQIAQMFVGIYILLYSSLMCSSDWFQNIFGMAMYLSFAVLFLKMYRDRYKN